MSPDAVSTPAPTISGESRLILLWMVVVFAIVFVPFLVFAIRRATISGPRANRGARAGARAVTVDAWSEAGRRLVGEPGSKRLDDTVDLDPFEPEDEPW